MNLHFTSHSLPISCRSDEDLRQFQRAAILELNEDVLLNNIRHFLLMLLPLVYLLLQLSDLL